MSTRTAIRAFYLLFFFALACMFVFLPPYLKECRGLSDRQLGYLFMIRPLLGLLSQPLWGYVADVGGRRSWVAGGLAVTAALTFPLIPLTDSFVQTAIVVAVFAAFHTPLVSLGDSIAFSYLGESRRFEYAGLRVWGTVGFMIAAPCVGMLNDRYGLQVIFGAYSAAMIISAMMILRVPSSPGSGPRVTVASLGLLLRNRNLMLMLGVMATAAVAGEMGFVYLNVYARRLGASHSAVGWMWAGATLVETVAMPWLPWIIRRIGIKRMLLLGFAFAVVRWTPMALLSSWRPLVFLQLFHGLAFSFVFVGSVTFMDMESPSHVRSSAQALHAWAVSSGGKIVGALLGAELSVRLGYESMYLVTGSLIGLCALLLGVLVREPGSIPARPAEVGDDVGV